MCQDNELLELINNDGYFRLKDSEINDGYILQDGTHFTKIGTNKLAKSLPLRSANSLVTKTGKMRGYNEVVKSVAPSSEAGTQATAQPARPTHARSWSSRAGSGISPGVETVSHRMKGCWKRHLVIITHSSQSLMQPNQWVTMRVISS